MDGWLPFPVISDLFLNCIAATGREDFPLMVGASARIRHWGIMGKLLSTAPDLHSALVEFVANHPRYARGAGAYLVDCGDDGLLMGYRIHYPGLRETAAFSLGAMAFARSVLSEPAASNRRGVLLSRLCRKTSRPTDAPSAERSLSSRRRFRARVLSHRTRQDHSDCQSRFACRDVEVRRGPLEPPGARHPGSCHARSRSLGARGHAVVESHRRPAPRCTPGP